MFISLIPSDKNEIIYCMGILRNLAMQLKAKTWVASSWANMSRKLPGEDTARELESQMYLGWIPKQTCHTIPIMSLPNGVYDYAAVFKRNDKPKFTLLSKLISLSECPLPQVNECIWTTVHVVDEVTTSRIGKKWPHQYNKYSTKGRGV